MRRAAAFVEIIEQRKRDEDAFALYLHRVAAQGGQKDASRFLKDLGKGG